MSVNKKNANAPVGRTLVRQPQAAIKYNNLCHYNPYKKNNKISQGEKNENYRRKHQNNKRF
jgi:hypothetical protein